MFLNYRYLCHLHPGSEKKSSDPNLQSTSSKIIKNVYKIGNNIILRVQRISGRISGIWL